METSYLVALLMVPLILTVSAQTFIRLPSHTLITVERTYTNIYSLVTCSDLCSKINNSGCVSWRYSSVNLTCEVSLSSAVLTSDANLGFVVYQVRARIPDGYYYNQHSGSCYRKVALSKTWPDHRKYCRDVLGDLAAEFHTEESFNWLKILHSQMGGWDNLYTSLRNNNGLGWRWTITQPLLNYSSLWLQDEPAAGSYCAVTDSSESGELGMRVISDSCNELHEFICEKTNCITN